MADVKTSERYDPISGDDLYVAALERIVVLKAQVERLTAPVSGHEKLHWNLSGDISRRVSDMIAARAAKE